MIFNPGLSFVSPTIVLPTDISKALPPDRAWNGSRAADCITSFHRGSRHFRQQTTGDFATKGGRGVIVSGKENIWTKKICCWLKLSKINKRFLPEPPLILKLRS
jgi:hypothetical protein